MTELSASGGQEQTLSSLGLEQKMRVVRVRVCEYANAHMPHSSSRELERWSPNMLIWRSGSGGEGKGQRGKANPTSTEAVEAVVQGLKNDYLTFRDRSRGDQA